MSELWIVQPYVPRYRVPFFERLFTELESDGVSVRVVASAPRGDQAARGDAIVPPWLTVVEPRVVRVGGASAVLTSTRRHWARADGVIVPHMGSSFDAYSALLSHGRSNRRVGVWGHIRSYVRYPNRVDSALEVWQLRRADEVFAYTPGGAAFAREAGVDPDRITTVMNALDTRSLEAALKDISDEEVSAFMGEHGLTRESTFAFIGGLDRSKRIDVLAAVLDDLWRDAPEIRVLVGGRGSQLHLLRSAVDRGQAIPLGYVDANQKALISRVSRALVSPGRIGLIAVEALVMQLPILTTRWPFHAPEFEYLSEPRTVMISDDSVAAFSRLLQSVASEPITPLKAEHAPPSLEEMVGRYRKGVIRMLG